jgi:hypothetical protein
MAVPVANDTIAPGGGFSAICISRPLVLAAGVSRIAVDIITGYSGYWARSGCWACSTAPTVRPSFPKCQPHGGVPNLPVGSYHAVLIGLDLALPPAGAAVTLTRAG